jgi:NADPH:quinone reductase-like Zn-dependent oxidoreductase
MFLSERMSIEGGFVRPIERGKIRQRLAIIQTFCMGNRAIFQSMNTFISRHQLRPVIDHIFPFAEQHDS